ncbi:MAG: Fungal specific transcription factor [Watsoniomyces obsoletus]|nr:MAG: Fungal specific transcription factor [Watsoniomyces obsoletus]
MPLSKTNRILILLAIDSSFFLLELIVGYAVHSLALVADSFHMLNDVLSLCVGLWAVKVAHDKPSSRFFTYGWQRAETLGALVNGVFLVALCLSIFLEAIQRLVEPQTVSNPKLVLIVGCFGLASNILGLFLFHDHGHSHGHGHADEAKTAEEGGIQDSDILDESGNVEDVLPGTIVGAWSTHIGQNGLTEANKDNKDSPRPSKTPRSPSARRSIQIVKGHQRHPSGSRSRYHSADGINVHPASFRAEIIRSAQNGEVDSDTPSVSEHDDVIEEEEDERPTEQTSLLPKNSHSTLQELNGHPHPHPTSHKSQHVGHKHRENQKQGKGGHSHGDLNMRGVFLHVMGDALGNIGVIGSALFIWLTPYWWRFYSDPIISLVITIIILASAIPLCKAASRILLQAVPAGINVDDIKADIEELPGVLGCHHLHVWQLSDTKLVASLHVEVDYDFKGEGSSRYMKLARMVRSCLHEYGIHSSTIQPEFCLDPSKAPGSSQSAAQADGGLDSLVHSRLGSMEASQRTSRAGSSRGDTQACLLECDDECANGTQCCTPNPAEGSDRHSHS